MSISLTFRADYLERVMATTTVYSRLFEFLTTSTIRALRRNHIVSTVFETIAKNTRKNTENKESSLSRCDHQFLMNQLSRTPPKFEGNVAWKQKQDLMSMAVQKKDVCNRTKNHTAEDLYPLRFKLIQKYICITLRL